MDFSYQGVPRTLKTHTSASNLIVKSFITPAQTIRKENALVTRPIKAQHQRPGSMFRRNDDGSRTTRDRALFHTTWLDKRRRWGRVGGECSCIGNVAPRAQVAFVCCGGHLISVFVGEEGRGMVGVCTHSISYSLVFDDMTGRTFGFNYQLICLRRRP